MTDYSIAIRKLLRLSLLGFIVVALGLGYWQVAMAPRLADDQYNQRSRMMLQRIQPGTIRTADGLVILDRQKAEGGQEGWDISYPAGRDFAHLTGYGPTTGLQRGLRDALYGLGRYADPWQDLLRGAPQGDDITLTIDSRAQRAALNELGNRRGAVVALDPTTGAVLVLASAPSFDPVKITSSQDEMNLFRYDPASPGLNRAIQGLYAPGSVFKIFTAAAALDLKAVKPQSMFTCAGTERVANAKIVCRLAAGHGSCNLDRAFYDSCNIIFAKVGLKIGIKNFIAYVKKFHLLDPANLALPSASGRIYNFLGFKGEIAMVEAAFGQGATMMAPFHVARLTAAIANHGHVLQPFLVQKVETPEKRVLMEGKAQDFGQAVSKAAADQVAGMMVDVVEKGTGQIAALDGVTVAAKTGSAQLQKGPANGWFTCYAPAEKPAAVVTVIVEGGETGSGSAGPIARRVLEQLLADRVKR